MLWLAMDCNKVHWNATATLITLADSLGSISIFEKNNQATAGCVLRTKKYYQKLRMVQSLLN